MQINEIIHILENEDSKGFIISNLNKDVGQLSLQNRDKYDFNLTTCLQLIKLYQKAKYKLPSFIGLALTEKSYQQASSEKVAHFKSQIINGRRLIDACGGLGVDDLAFSKSFTEVVSFDTDAELNQLVRYNFDKLAITNIERIDAEFSSHRIDEGDILYLDPDRRVEGKRSILLEDLEPNVLNILSDVPNNTEVWIKLSPLFEVKQIIQEVQGIAGIYAISEGNDVKEMLLHIITGRTFDDVALHAVELGEHAYHASTTKNSWSDNLALSDEISSYIIFARSACNKLHISDHLLQAHKATKINGMELYSSQQLIYRNEFRTYGVKEELPLQLKKLKRELKNRGIAKAELIVKGHSKKTDQWYKDLNLQQGDKTMLLLLFGTISRAFICEPIKS